MALDSISQPAAWSTSLFRPVPVNQLQQNLAQFYERTSSFVQEQFQEMAELAQYGNHSSKTKRESETRTAPPRLNPQGLGTFLDIRV
ncbi:MAG TPA: hypothetical protein PK878_16455 [bacterium]|nr:hypothetical protein [Candidatus Omnitrophota bacterium]HOJ61876.1 hypothetical protein [bacterium]HOL94007.1 hypothetical protein [bacterium]HPO99979.1 hypothetical protein [bacterium]HXK93623.1 hypothetical protein [bacterium]